VGGCFPLSWKLYFLLYKCHNELYNNISSNTYLSWLSEYSSLAMHVPENVSDTSMYWESMSMKKDIQHFSPYKENFFPKKHSDSDIFHLIVSSHTAKQSVQNCVLPCANLHVITLYQSSHNALQQKHCQYMPHTRVMLIQRRDNGGVRGTRQFLMCFLNLTWMKKPFMDFDALCPSSDLLTKLQK